MDVLQAVCQTLEQVKAKKPLVHQLTNFVTANDCANVTLALGASPVMTNDPGEVEEMVSFASALVLNIGTLNGQLVDSMILAGRAAAVKGIPVIFDPVGVGATKLRTQAAERIIREIPLAVIRGNMSEIKTLAGINEGIRGVDSTAGHEQGQMVAANLSKRLGCVVAITGAVDIIAREDEVYHITNGHPLLADVTGTGCMSTALTGCCCGVADPVIGAIAGIAVMGIAGEIAQKSLAEKEGLGTFRVRLIDAISAMNGDTFKTYAKIKGA
ncbi:hydroxyethylthiazole kinase [Anaerospora sp.]|uniref:hydroxyethylthiazole kinase n=1 Tax=Anaerospora sp. TaxID=1960278 RepID=UPI0028A13FBA|nr:hydroxyethylthiazole kinase [Anaerospora sp.]